MPIQAVQGDKPKIDSYQKRSITKVILHTCTKFFFLYNRQKHGFKVPNSSIMSLSSAHNENLFQRDKSYTVIRNNAHITTCQN